MKYIIKRDGRREPMNASKIAVAIQCAMDETTKGSDGVVAWKIAEEIFNDTNDEKTVEQVEDLVLEKLKANARKDAARKYDSYRKERSRIRNKKSQFMKTIHLQSRQFSQ